MFELLTECSRKAVVDASESARELGHGFIGAEHLLIGMLSERDGIAAQALGSLGVTLDEVRSAVQALAPPSPDPLADAIPFTPRAKRVLDLAKIESEQREVHFIGTEHLLLGLAAEPGTEADLGAAGHVLKGLGVTAEGIRTAVDRLLPVGDGGLSWMLRRKIGVEVRGVQGAGWIDVLSLDPDVHLRRLLRRAAVMAMDADGTVLEVGDLVGAFVEFPTGAELLRELGLEPKAQARVTARPASRGWVRVDASDQVIAVVLGAQTCAVEDRRDTVMLSDLLLALAATHGSVLDACGLDSSAIRASLARRRARDDTM